MESKDRVVSLFCQYLAFEQGLSENTLAAYRQDVETFASFLADKSFDKTAPEDIVMFMRDMRTKGLSMETILRRLSGLSQFFDFLIKEKAVGKNPVEFITKPQKWDKLPNYLNFDEVEKLLEAPDSSLNIGYRDSLILEMLYASGMRVSELLGVRIMDIDFKRGLVKVHGKGAKERYVPIYKKLTERIYNWLPARQDYFVKQSDEGWLFLNRRGGQLTRQFVWQMIKDYCEDVGINKRISPHSLRHSFATHLLSGGADLRTIQIFLGHENIATTEIYTHITDDKKRDTLRKFHPRFNNKG